MGILLFWGEEGQHWQRSIIKSLPHEGNYSNNDNEACVFVLLGLGIIPLVSACTIVTWKKKKLIFILVYYDTDMKLKTILFWFNAHQPIRSPSPCLEQTMNEKSSGSAWTRREAVEIARQHTRTLWKRLRTSPYESWILQAILIIPSRSVRVLGLLVAATDGSAVGSVARHTRWHFQRYFPEQNLQEGTLHSFCQPEGCWCIYSSGGFDEVVDNSTCG